MMKAAQSTVELDDSPVLPKFNVGRHYWVPYPDKYCLVLLDLSERPTTYVSARARVCICSVIGDLTLFGVSAKIYSITEFRSRVRLMWNKNVMVQKMCLSLGVLVGFGKTGKTKQMQNLNEIDLYWCSEILAWYQTFVRWEESAIMFCIFMMI